MKWGTSEVGRFKRKFKERKYRKTCSRDLPAVAIGPKGGKHCSQTPCLIYEQGAAFLGG
jgi:hypothetical protein